MQAGRWASERSAKIYIMKGEVLLLRMSQLLTRDQRNIIRDLVGYGSRLGNLLMAGAPAIDRPFSACELPRA